MPPKIRISKEAILDAAFEITQVQGISAVNARVLAFTLSCSVQPIFRCFENMEKLKQALYEKAGTLFNESMAKGMENRQISFLGMGLAYIHFARTEKNLFKFLFMSEEFRGMSIIDMIRNDKNNDIVQLIAKNSGLSISYAEQLFLSIWLTTHGIASLMATNDFDLSEDQMVQLLSDVFAGTKNQLGTKGEKA